MIKHLKTSFFLSKRLWGQHHRKSHLVVVISQIAVALGVCVSLIALCTGVGLKNTIREKIASYQGHITINHYNNRTHIARIPIFFSDSLKHKIKATNGVLSMQEVAYYPGLIKTDKAYQGIVLKGIGKDYKPEFFKPHLTKGRFPLIDSKAANNESLISEKIANKFSLKLNDFYTVYFLRENKSPLIRNFEVVGLYRTDIKEFDDVFIMSDLRHVQKSARWGENQVSALEVFSKNISDIETLKDKLSTILGYQYELSTALERNQNLIDWLDLFDVNILVIFIIMLIVVLVNITMVCFILIIDKTATIGVLKSMGAKNILIQWVFVFMGLRVLLRGLFFGNLLTLSFLLMEKSFRIIPLNPEAYYTNHVPVDLNIYAIIILNLGLVFICTIALLFPSYWVSRISPKKIIQFS